MISFGFFLGEGSPAIWRGPKVSKAVKQFARGVAWPELDVLSSICRRARATSRSASRRRWRCPARSSSRSRRASRPRKRARRRDVPHARGAGARHRGEHDRCVRSRRRSLRRERARRAILGEVPFDDGIVGDGDAGVPTMIARPDGASAAHSRRSRRAVADVPRLAPRRSAPHDEPRLRSAAPTSPPATAPAPGGASRGSSSTPVLLPAASTLPPRLLYLVAGAVGLVWIAPELAIGAYPSPHVAGVTHLFTLGWLTTTILARCTSCCPWRSARRCAPLVGTRELLDVRARCRTVRGRHCDERARRCTTSASRSSPIGVILAVGNVASDAAARAASRDVDLGGDRHRARLPRQHARARRPAAAQPAHRCSRRGAAARAGARTSTSRSSGGR